MDTETASERLHEERLRLEELIAHTTRDSLEVRSSAGERGDVNDLVEPLIAGQEENAVLAGLHARLAAVGRAEQRIIDGTYGRSVRSGRAISAERLEADPAAELTFDEAEQDSHG